MPCGSIQTVTVDLGKLNKELLAQALNAMNIRNWQYDEQSGKLTVRGQGFSNEDTLAIKRQYSKQVVFSQAKKYGWAVKEVSAFKWEVQRR